MTLCSLKHFSIWTRFDEFMPALVPRGELGRTEVLHRFAADEISPKRMLARVTEARSSLRAAEQRPKSSHARTVLACGAVGLHKVFTEIASRLFALCHGAA
jgi:hypothetical protein